MTNQQDSYAQRLQRLQQKAAQQAAASSAFAVQSEASNADHAGLARSGGPRLGLMLALGAIVFGFLAALPIVDYTLFSAYSERNGKAANFGAYVEYRTTGLRSSAEPEEAVARDYVREPLTIAEKAKMLRNIDDALPVDFQGWTRRAYHKDDYWALNPDLAACRGRSKAQSMRDLIEGSYCPSGTGAKDTVTFEKGNRLIVVRLRFQRDRDFKDRTRYIPPGKISPRSNRIGIIASAFGGVGNGSYWDYKYYSSFLRRGQFHFVERARDQKLSDGTVIRHPHRIYMRTKNDGVLDAFIVSNASSTDVKRFINAMDFGLLSAMVATVPSALRPGTEIEQERNKPDRSGRMTSVLRN